MIKFTDITKSVIENTIMLLWKLAHINTKSDYITNVEFRRDCNNTRKFTNTK